MSYGKWAGRAEIQPTKVFQGAESIGDISKPRKSINQSISINKIPKLAIFKNIEKFKISTLRTTYRGFSMLLNRLRWVTTSKK